MQTLKAVLTVFSFSLMIGSIAGAAVLEGTWKTACGEDKTGMFQTIERKIEGNKMTSEAIVYVDSSCTKRAAVQTATWLIVDLNDEYMTTHLQSTETVLISDKVSAHGQMIEYRMRDCHGKDVDVNVPMDGTCGQPGQIDSNRYWLKDGNLTFEKGNFQKYPYRRISEPQS